MMKHLLTALTLALGLTVPLLAHANPAPLTAVPNRAKSRTVSVVRAPQDSRAVYYITDTTSTGSHIPIVIRQYRGRREVLGGGFRAGSVYGAGAIAATGALDLGTALRRLDPSFF